MPPDCFGRYRRTYPQGNGTRKPEREDQGRPATGKGRGAGARTCGNAEAPGSPPGPRVWLPR
ncbi:hypothetical protein GCM10010106_09660 [Thermopolyspora flexuosa]|nr:hypothetical protein GCM10010106_09660 [Thermopolyspora flexuosa]